jgi:hypothetical protein
MINRFSVEMLLWLEDPRSTEKASREAAMQDGLLSSTGGFSDRMQDVTL